MCRLHEHISFVCVISMSASAAPGVGAVHPVFVCGTLKNSWGGLSCDNSLTSPNGRIADSVILRSRRLDTSSSIVSKDEVRKGGFACESRTSDEMLVYCRDPHSQGHHRPSHVPLALSTFPFTQSPASDATSTEKWRLDDEILELRGLQSQLLACKKMKEKIATLDSNKRVRGVFGGSGRSGVYVKPAVALASRDLDEVGLYSLKCLVAIGQEHLLDSPWGLRDAYAVQEKSSLRQVSRSPSSSVKEALTRVGNIIESWERHQGKFWQSMSALSMPWTKTLQYLSSEDQASCDTNELWSEYDTESRLLESLHVLIAVLARLENFYDSIGGIVG